MFWNKKTDLTPLGVPLEDLLMLFKSTSIKASIKENALIAKHANYNTRIEVVPPEDRESENRPIKAVVRIITELPSPILKQFINKEVDAVVAFNKFTALGALTYENGKIFIGSRLTINEEEDSWDALHMPLLFFSAVLGSEAILGGIRRTFSQESPNLNESKWGVDDFEGVGKVLSIFCVCTTGETGFSAEFGLEDGATSAMSGDHMTALYQMSSVAPHPELGGGLFTLLQLPHQFADKVRLREVCIQLNNMEMAADALPPHFGAWCEGKNGNNLAYVSFYPNAMYIVPGIAINIAFWALNRAEWANSVLASLSVRA